MPVCIAVFCISLPSSGNSPGAQALRGIRPSTIMNLEWAWSHVAAYCQSRHIVVLSASVFNSFPDVAQFKLSDSLAKCSHSGVCWLADIFGFERPVDRMTLGLCLPSAGLTKQVISHCLVGQISSS